MAGPNVHRMQLCRPENRAKHERALKCQAFEKTLRDKEKRRKAANLKKGVSGPEQFRERTASETRSTTKSSGFFRFFKKLSGGSSKGEVKDIQQEQGGGGYREVQRSESDSNLAVNYNDRSGRAINFSFL